jgi:hypothetical protein
MLTFNSVWNQRSSLEKKTCNTWLFVWEQEKSVNMLVMFLFAIISIAYSIDNKNKMATIVSIKSIEKNIPVSLLLSCKLW